MLIFTALLFTLSHPCVFAQTQNAPINITLEISKKWSETTEEISEESKTKGFLVLDRTKNFNGLKAACELEAFSSPNLYGKAPKIEYIDTRKRKICIITPSSDQPKDIKDFTSALIEYQSPRVDDLVVIHAKKKWIQSIAKSVKIAESK